MKLRFPQFLRDPRFAYATLFAGGYAAFMIWQSPVVQDGRLFHSFKNQNIKVGPLLALNHTVSLRDKPAVLPGTPESSQHSGIAAEGTNIIAEAQQALTAAQEKQASDTAITAMGTSNVDARVTALGQLSGIATPDVMMALNQSLHDRESRIRFVAVDSLRQIAANQGDADGSIRSMIRNAMSDRDPQVASKAKEAYEELNALLTPG